MKLMHVSVSMRKGDPTTDDMVAINNLLDRGATLVATHAVQRRDIHAWVVYVLDITDLYEGPM